MHRLTWFLTAVVALLSCSRPALADDKELKATIEKAIKAHGGAEKLNKYPAATAQMTGKMSLMEMTFDFTGAFTIQAPDKLKVVLDFEAGGMTFKTVQILNKNKGWLKVNENVMELDKEHLAEAKEELHASSVVNQLTPLLGKEYKLSSLGEVKVNDMPAVGIQVSRKGFRDLNIFFDKKTHLVVKVERRVKDGLTKQEVTQEDFHDDFREVSGLKLAHKLKIKRDGKDYMEATISEPKLTDQLPENTFVKP